MENNRLYTLKDFELSTNESLIDRSNHFQNYIEQLNEVGPKSYWTQSSSGVGSRMDIEDISSPVISFVSNDYLGMSQRIETKEAGINDIALIDSFIHTSTLAGLKDTHIKHIGHNNLEYLEIALKDVKDKFKTKLVIIDGVYSQDGDLSKLPEIIKLCHKYGAMLMMDDAITF